GRFIIWITSLMLYFTHIVRTSLILQVPTSMANALTMIRLALVIPFALFMANGNQRHAVFALVAMIIALATDFLDGPIARKTGTASAFGGTFDHTTDFLFVTSGLFAGA